MFHFLPPSTPIFSHPPNTKVLPPSGLSTFSLGTCASSPSAFCFLVPHHSMFKFKQTQSVHILYDLLAGFDTHLFSLSIGLQVFLIPLCVLITSLLFKLFLQPDFRCQRSSRLRTGPLSFLSIGENEEQVINNT